MESVYKVRYTTDREEYKTISIIAETRAKAYVEVMIHIPDAEIVSIINVNTYSWTEAIARYAITYATVDELQKIMSCLDESKQDELTEAIFSEWKAKPRGGRNERLYTRL